MSAIRNVGAGLVAHIVAEREAGGPYADFYDFCERVDLQVLNKRTIESLIKGGAFDSMGHPRKGLLQVFEPIIDRTIERRKREAEGQFDLFAAFGDEGGAAGARSYDDARLPVPDVEFDKAQRLAFEKEMLGLYVSDHPLMGAEASLRKYADCTITELRDSVGGTGRDSEVKLVGGVVTNLVRKYTKKGELMATFVLEDLEAAIEAWVFPRTMQEYGSLLADDVVVCVKGRIDTREDTPKLVAMEVRRVEVIADAGPPLRVKVPVGTLTDTKVDQLKSLLVDHPGDSPVFLHVGTKTLRLPDEFLVDTSNGLCAELRVLFGADCLL
jgi:DNA polymerase III subunit alpha